MTDPDPSRHVRCTLCGAVLPGWLPLPNVPDSSMLLHHLGNHHLAEAKPYLKRMETECIDTVVMKLFERIDA
jgi:hypothetical protein